MREINRTVFLVDDEPAILKALRQALQQHRYEVTSHLSAGEFLDTYQGQPGCLLLDFQMADMSGLELQAEIAKRKLHIPIVFISGHGGVPESVAAIKAGAVDFLQKPFSTERLLSVIDEAFAIDDSRRKLVEEADNLRSKFDRLTDREKDILQLLMEGQSISSSKAIANQLGISHRTVEHYRSRILEKTGTKTIAELRYVVRIAGIDEAEGPIDVS